MKAHLVIAASAAIMLFNTSHAGQTKSGNTPKPAPQVFDGRTGEWKSARPKPVVQKYPTSTSLPKPRTWSWQRLAMQPLRFIVMAAKVPLIPAGMTGAAYVVGSENLAGRPMEFPDFGPAFENFDPGPAIDADLERRERGNVPRDESRPSPPNTRLKITRANSASSVRSPGTGKTAMKNRERTALSIPIHSGTSLALPCAGGGLALSR
jgi:hypothetical protein